MGRIQDELYPSVSDPFSPLPTMICLQETKLVACLADKARSFLPPCFSNFKCIDVWGTCGGILTAQDSSALSLSSFIACHYTLTIPNVELTVTNVYAPLDRHDSLTFLESLSELRTQVLGAWLLLGDFNLTWGADDKSNANLNASLCSTFNDAINKLELIELPHLDRIFTWSNKRVNPTLARLRCTFVNTDMNHTFPNTTLTSYVCTTSDHMLLLVVMYTTLPKPSTFCFENSWLLQADFLHSVLLAWNLVHLRGDVVATLATSLKATRCEAKVWSMLHCSPPTIHHNCKFIIHMLDVLKEYMSLFPGEQHLRGACQLRLA
ncbi:uncharacterized protein LOC133913238 [Phragmites australis]|uniref:uncharacterized protein LOC133913238 n=1 Tax=Phragmites australis TaxID=29695 RepID=UPI002D774336|nr:uncharacterized protein LOC133913238 [Phragmites australis]